MTAANGAEEFYTNDNNSGIYIHMFYILCINTMIILCMCELMGMNIYVCTYM
jgi:hypothetical protein